MKQLAGLSLILFFSFQLLNAQCISGDCKNGRGIYIYPSGAKYIGDFVNGEIHGIGTCEYTDGSKYQGQWIYRYPEGKGTKTFADGSKVTGLWKKGQAINEEGEILEDILVSKGKDDDGTDIQAGCISGDCDDGEGVFAYSDGSKYEGKFQNSKINGWGTWYFPDGSKYIGNFKDNLKNGKGTLYEKGGEKKPGEWLKGEYIGNAESDFGQEGCITGDCLHGSGTYVYKAGGAKYVGEFLKEKPHGNGICYYANGEKYEGEWSNGSFNGLGTLYLTDGNKVEGIWEGGTFISKEIIKEKIEIAETKTADEVIETVKEIQVKKDAGQMKVWAVVIGVSSYSHMPFLRYTDDDAYRVYAFLKSPEGGALSDEQVQILIDEDATKENITKSMEKTFSKAGPNDLVILYFSGHGLKGSFLPIDFDGFNNKLKHDEINALFDQSKAKYKLCIADACHSGSLMAMRGGNVESALETYYKTLAQAQAGTALIMSSKSEETSLESSGLRQGVFSHFLIRGLKGEADMNANKIVSVNELYDYISKNVKSYTGMRQSPVIKGEYDENMTVGVIR